MIFFDSNLAKIGITFDISKTDDQRTWVNLKNSKDETVISLLYSVYCDLRVSNNNYNSQSMLDSSYLGPGKTIKHDISIDVNRNRSNTILKLMNKGNNSVIEGHTKTNNKMEIIKEQLNNTACKLQYNSSDQKLGVNRLDSNSNRILL
jgi:hypothetical protein